MTFSQRKRETLRPARELKLSTFLAAILVASAFFVPYIIAGKGYFIFFGDFNVQQIPFYKMCHAAIKSGNTKWVFNTDLGANFVGSYSFYLLGSPFFWLTLLFPTSFVPHLMGPLLILKFGCAAFTSYVYIRRFTRTPEAARLGALLYAFSGFSVYNIFFNHFHEAIIVFPLLLLAMEYLITENKRGVFALTVCVAAITNYFFFFGMVVFCVIYFFVREGTKAIKPTALRFLSLTFEAVLGVLMASVLLIPSIKAISDNVRVGEILLGWNALTYGKEQIYLNILECFFFPPDLPARPVFFPGADVKWSSLGGWLPLFGMTGVIAWFSARKKTWIKRLLCICIFMSLVPILNSAFYAFNSAYYARWFYMPILIMCLATARVTEEEDIDIKDGLKWTVPITVVFALLVGFFPRRDEKGNILIGLFVNSDTKEYIFKYWSSVLIAVGSLAAVIVLYVFFNKNRKRFIMIATALVCIISVGYANIFVYLGRSHSYNIPDVMIDSLIEGEVKLEGDKDTYRIDTYSCVDNTGMYLGYNTMNAFHSVVPPSIMDFYQYVGIVRDVGSRAEVSYPALRPLFSVKYLLDLKGDESFVDDMAENKMPGYNYVKTSGQYYIYENTNYVGYGFSYDYAMDDEYCENYDGNSITRLMLKAMHLSDEDMRKYSGYIKNIKDAAILEEEDEEITDEDETVIEEEESSAEESVNESGSSSKESKAEENSSKTKSEGESSSESKQDSEEQETKSEEQESEEPEEEEEIPAISLALTDEQMAEDCNILRASAAKKFKIDNDGFTATVSRDKKSLVFFSVPYDSGWTATVNGKPVDIIKANVGFMAVPVEKGDSTIRFDYETPGLTLGLTITGIAFVIFVAYFVLTNNKKNEKEDYPEGDELIKMWQAVEINEIESHKEEPAYKGFLDGLSGLNEQRANSGEEITGGFSIDTDIFDDE